MTKEKRNEYMREYKRKNKEKIAERNKIYNDKNKEKRKEYYEDNKDVILDKQKEYYDDNKECIREKQKEYNATHKELKSKKSKEWYEKNKERIKEKQKELYQENKEYIIKRNCAYRDNRLKNDPTFKLIYSIRTRTRLAIKEYSLTKNKSTMKMLGCDKITLMEHLQQTAIQYDPNFNIYDYDGSQYHIDHIKTFADVQKGLYTIEEVCHYTNLQILPSEINLAKGGLSW